MELDPRIHIYLESPSPVVKILRISIWLHNFLCLKKCLPTPYFHFPYHEARRELKVKVNTNLLQLMATPKNLGVKLDQLLTYPQHPDNLSTRISSHVTPILRLAGTTWETTTNTLCVSTQILFPSLLLRTAPQFSAGKST